MEQKRPKARENPSPTIPSKETSREKGLDAAKPFSNRKRKAGHTFAIHINHSENLGKIWKFTHSFLAQNKTTTRPL